MTETDDHNPDRKPENFEDIYLQNAAPWEIGEPQPEVIALAEQELIVGDVLDIGCGTGENTLMLVARGHMVWGVDASATALERARRKAAERELEATFVLGSALELDILGEGFHTVIDSALFHVFDDSQREKYLACLRHVMFPGARLFLLCFSDEEPEGWGPRRVRRSELRHLFSVANGFKVKEIRPARYQVQERPEGVKAWLAVIKRLAED